MHFDLPRCSNSCCNHLPPGAAQKHRTLQVGVAFKNRHDIDKALERLELKNGGSFCLLRCQRCPSTVETGMGMFFRWEWVDLGDIPIEIQPKLLRALQEREFERLGNNRTKQVDLRLVAATNRDLEKMMENREFRSDLYYRLNVAKDDLTIARHQRSLGEIIVLPAGKFFHGFGGDGLDLLLHAPTVLLGEVSDEQRNILRAFTQRRDSNRKLS